MPEHHKANTIRIGCAGWSISKQHATLFPPASSQLERYAQRFNAVEINSSFYRPHLPATYARWAATTPADFSFAVKMPKAITHTRRLAGAVEPLERFLAEIGQLGAKLGPVLVQLPPSLAFNAPVAGAFFTLLRERFAGPVACEPRHSSWFSAEAEALLIAARVARVAADPAIVPQAATPGGCRDLAYYRLHGSPEMYTSAYSKPYLDALAQQVSLLAAPGWCIFDNTALGAATTDALELMARLEKPINLRLDCRESCR
jgi:uncharacterized protein YecE (DUF72 family)